MMDAILNFDLSVFTFVAEHIWADWLTPIMVGLTTIGDGIIWIVLGLAMLISKKTRKIGIAVLLSLLVMEIANNLIIKELVARPRPFNLVESGKASAEILEKWAATYHYPDFVKQPSSWSFPSGHTSSSFASAFAIAYTSKNKLYGTLSFILAAAIAFTRIYVHVHYCTDILGGIVVGIIYGIIGSLLAIKLYELLQKKLAAKGKTI